MRIQLRERQIPPDRDREILDILGLAGPRLTLSLLQTVSDCVQVVTPEGRLLFVNQIGLDELMGGWMDEVRDTPWTSYWPQVARPTLEEALDLCTGGRHLSCEVPRPTEDGMDRMWIVDMSPLLDHRGDLLGVLVMSRDITANTNDAPQGHGT